MPKVNDGEHDKTRLLDIKPGFNDARKVIKKNLLLRELDAALICQELEISRSGLFRLFEGHGGVDAYIRGERLNQVRLAILKYGNRVRVQDLAKHWYFSDSSHLGRLFRQKYGLTITKFKNSLKS